jgi:cation-transporting ATPase I
MMSVKGAPEVVLGACTHFQPAGSPHPLDRGSRRLLAEDAGCLAGQGLRVLAVAEVAAGSETVLDPAELEGLCFRGFVAFSDPVRPAAAATLEGLGRAGVDVLMLTGDHASTAESIASELGLPCRGATLTGTELAAMSDEELELRVGRTCVFARVTPAQKVRVVRALQRAGRVVAMVGDGANDAHAIRLANVGLAIGERSTTAARGASDIVVTDEHVEGLVHAIVEGRAMWASVRDAVSILVGGNLGEIAFTLAAGLLDGRPPLHARQLLLVNLLTDVAPAMAIALHAPPRSRLDCLANEGPAASLGQPLNRAIALRAATTASGAAIAWLAGRMTGNEARARTMGLAALVGTQLGQTLVSGGTSLPVVATSVASALALVSVIQTPALSHFFGCRPLGPLEWAGAAGSSALATYAAYRLLSRSPAAPPRPQLPGQC